MGIKSPDSTGVPPTPPDLHPDDHIFENAAVGIAHVALDGCLLRVNKHFAELLGYSREELIGRNFREFTHPDDLEENNATLQAFLAGTSDVYVVEKRYLRADGSPLWAIVTASLVRDESGTPDHLVSVIQGITALKEAAMAVKEANARIATEEKARRETETQFLSTFENMAVGLAHAGLDGRWLMVNERFCEIVGRTREELLSGSFPAVTHPDDVEAGVASLNRFREEKQEISTSEKRYIHPDGSIIWATVTTSLVRDVSGAPHFVASVIQDITALKEAEESLRARSEQLAQFFNVSPDLFCVADVNGKYLELNPGWERIFGFSIEEFMSAQSYDFIHPDDKAAHRAAMKELAIKGEVNGFVNRHLCKDGGYRWLEWHAVKVGELVYAAARDITLRVEAEDAARSQSEQLERYFGVALDLLCVVDMEGRLLRLNPQWEHVLGYMHDELLNKHWLERVHPDDQAAGVAVLAQHAAGQNVTDFVNRYRCKDGSYRWFEWRSAVTEGLIHGAARDITDRINSEAEVARLASFPLRNPSPIVEVGPDDTLRFLNPVARELMPSLESLGSRHAFLSALDEIRTRTMQGEKVPIFTTVWVGARCYLQHWSVTPENGCLRVYALDDTERAQVQEELNRMNEELEQLVTERTAELRWATEALHAETLQRLEAQQHLSAAVLEERTRIAREIHDTLAQGFTGVILQLEAAVGEEGADMRHHIRQAQDLARRNLEEARRSVRALRPQALKEGDLASALASSVQEMAQASQARIEFVRQGAPRRLTTEMEQHLLRLGQEAVTNALKHARASAVRVHLAFTPERVELRIEDDGQGITPTKDGELRGFGLRGMSERVENLKGHLEITSRPGEGTCVVVSVPAPSV